jgi:acylglycerol lipase
MGGEVRVKISEYDGRKYFTGWAGLDLHFQERQPEGEPLASIVLVHGFALHAGWFASVIDTLLAAGFSVFTFDLRGHGRSEGVRCDLVKFSDHVRDLSTFVEYARLKSPGKRVFVVAHSLGASVAVLFASIHQATIDGLVTTGLYVKDAGDYSRWKHVVGRLLAPFLPLVPIQELDTNRLALDPAVEDEYKRDPLVYNGNVRIRMAMHFLNLERYLNGAPAGIDVPLLIFHGAEDNVASIDGSRMLYSESPSEDKKIIEVGGSGHEVLKDYPWKKVCDTIIRWLTERS